MHSICYQRPMHHHQDYYEDDDAIYRRRTFQSTPWPVHPHLPERSFQRLESMPITTDGYLTATTAAYPNLLPFTTTSASVSDDVRSYADHSWQQGNTYGYVATSSGYPDPSNLVATATTHGEAQNPVDVSCQSYQPFHPIEYLTQALEHPPVTADIQFPYNLSQFRPSWQNVAFPIPLQRLQKSDSNAKTKLEGHQNHDCGHEVKNRNDLESSILKQRLDRQAVAKSFGQSTRSRKVSIVKGDRGKQSRAESCWRCRRYKKVCNKAIEECGSCVTSGFRVWPSSLGCRRGQMTDFVLLIIPINVESLAPSTVVYSKPISWRKVSNVYDGRFGDLTVTKIDRWDKLLTKIQAIRILGPGVVELIQIAANYERRQAKQNNLLTLAARCLSTTIDLWHIFTALQPGETFDHKLNVKEVFVTLRQLLISCVQRFLTTCLTGRLKDWFPTFMAVNILGLVYILLGDTILVIPNKTEVWPDIRKTVLELRSFHPVTRDLLYVLAKGCDILNMDWGNSDEVLRLMDGDTATCESMHELQMWRDNLMDFLNDDGWMTAAPFEVDMLPVTSLSRLFISPERQESK